MSHLVISAERIVLSGAGVPLGTICNECLNATVDHYRRTLEHHDDWVTSNALLCVLDELHHRALNENMDRRLHAQVQATQREFDEEMATRHRQRDTPALRTIESMLGLRRRRP
jgi:hypothetical protein